MITKRKDVFKITVLGKGYLGSEDVPVKENGKQTKAYKAWNSMLRRCYNQKRLAKWTTYQDCEVCEEWLNFTIFDRWFREHYVEGFDLDKDILSDGKLYSPEHCVFVPRHVNTLLMDNKSRRGLWPQGVSYQPDRDKFAAAIVLKGKHTNLGRFTDPMSAYQKYRETKLDYVNKLIVEDYSFLEQRIKDAILVRLNEQLPENPVELN